MVRIKGVTLTACTIGALAFLCGNVIQLQSQDRRDEQVVTVHGRVLNAVTNEPVARALVNLQGLNAATFTDDRGQFELSIPEKISPATEGFTTMRLGGIEVRKLGFLQDERMPTTVPNSSAKDLPELLVRLLPEAKIVGHIDVPGSEGDVRIECQLFRKELNDGRQTWAPQRTFINWVDGEFRFFGLRPGTYKLITHEQLDQETLATSSAQLYGYPPMYYPNTTDFSLSTPIVVKAGETARVNLTVARKEYYRVRIPVENLPGAPRLNLSVYPMGHPSPGWSLGYNPREGAIVGILPDGNYTVEANTAGENELTGISNFSVKGKSLDGPTLTLIPDANIPVRVREEFQSTSSNFGMLQGVGDAPHIGSRQYSNVSVNLIPLDDLNTFGRAASSRMSDGSQGQELSIPDVRPGRYRVEVNATGGYVSSIQSGGKDLAHQPLVVMLGGEVAPIEIVLRDDGAQVSGTLDEGTTSGPTDTTFGASPRSVYLLPLEESGRPSNVQTWQGTFLIDQLPAGSYLLLAFDQPRQDLPSGPGEAMQRLMSKGQVIHVESSQKVNVHVKVISGEFE